MQDVQTISFSFSLLGIRVIEVALSKSWAISSVTPSQETVDLTKDFGLALLAAMLVEQLKVWLS